MCDVTSVLEGHWLTYFVSITYSAYCFRRSFFQTTWNHSFFSRAVRREDHVHQSLIGRCTSRLQPIVRKELDLCNACSGCHNFLHLVVSTRGMNRNH
jgi:hypothetical protein